MAGYRFVRDKTFVTVFAGVDVQYHRFTPYDPTNVLRGTHAGIRGAIEFWHEPDAHSMWAADASVSSIGPSYAGRVAFGWRMCDAFYLGPEVAASPAATATSNFAPDCTSPDFASPRSNGRLAPAGLRDSNDREGFYGRIGLIARR